MELLLPAFAALLSITALQTLDGGAEGPQPPPAPRSTPWIDLGDPEAVADWREVHDGVMGGRSSGSARALEALARFSGRVSLENNGGFASFRAAARPDDSVGTQGLRLAVRGDGQVYRLQLRLDGRWDGVSWQSSFETRANAWTVVELPFESFLPTWRGRLVTAAPPLEPAAIRQVGISIADKQVGAFQLDVAWIEGASIEGSALPEDIPPGSVAAEAQRSRELQDQLDAESGASGDDLGEALRWSERLAVIALPGDLDPASSVFLGQARTLGSEFAQRELRVLLLTGDSAGRLAGRTLTADQVTALRRRWGLETGRWALGLVGKDGQLKASWDELVRPETLFEKIDAMPMRTQELEQRGD